MAINTELVEWLRKGYSPSQIAAKVGAPVDAVVPYLYEQVAQGVIHRADIVSSIDRKVRLRAEEIVRREYEALLKSLVSRYRKSENPTEQDISVYFELGRAKSPLAEMYELITRIELTLHSYIKTILVNAFGDVDWWRRGIPENIRAECAAAREKDPEPASHPFCYTTFIHLKEILKIRWTIFSGKLPRTLAADKRYLLSCLTRVNRIRNCVMHPVRDNVLGDEEFRFAREFEEYIDREELI